MKSKNTVCFLLLLAFFSVGRAMEQDKLAISYLTDSKDSDIGIMSTLIDDSNLLSEKEYLAIILGAQVFSQSIKSIVKKPEKKLNQLSDNSRKHTGKKPFKCKYCQKTFVRPSYWRTHENIKCKSNPSSLRYEKTCKSNRHYFD